MLHAHSLSGRIDSPQPAELLSAPKAGNSQPADGHSPALAKEETCLSCMGTQLTEAQQRDTH